MRKDLAAVIVAIIIIFFISPIIALANNLADSDLDMVPDRDEINIYHTDPYNADTDGDGYGDWTELVSGFSPLDPDPIKLEDSDTDGDGLSDRMELSFKSDLTNTDTDGDGYTDGEEITNGYDPLNGDKAALEKRIEINTGAQKLSYFLGGVRMGTFPVSSGVNGSTSLGEHVIRNKSPKAWSPYGLWMPYWLGLDSGRFGIHELPIWPNGRREGENHLGTPVSHGCIRLGEGPAKKIYDWVPIGTKVFIY